jgi:predicted O-methyltransferase YrrM
MGILNSARHRAKYAINSAKRRLKIYRELPIHVSIVDNAIFQASPETDISDHLNVIFSLTMAKKPKTILELGTRGGESTKVLTLAADLIDAKGYSADLSDAPEWLKERENWHHFVADDTEFYKLLKDKWPNGDKYSGIDFLFLDTSHFYDHTMQELNLYWDLLNDEGVLLLHDTNSTAEMTRRFSGNSNQGWDNQRVVIRAVENFFGCEIDENRFVSSVTLGRGASALTHYPWNNGLTVIFK